MLERKSASMIKQLIKKLRRYADLEGLYCDKKTPCEICRLIKKAKSLIEKLENNNE